MTDTECWTCGSIPGATCPWQSCPKGLPKPEGWAPVGSPAVGSRWLHGESTAPVYTVVGHAEMHTAEVPSWDLQPMVVYTSSSPAAAGRWFARTVEEWHERFRRTDCDDTTRPEAEAPESEAGSSADNDCDDTDCEAFDRAAAGLAAGLAEVRKVRRNFVASLSASVTRAEFDDLADTVRSLTSGAGQDVREIGRLVREWMALRKEHDALVARVAALEERTRPLGPVAEPIGDHVEALKERRAIMTWLRQQAQQSSFFEPLLAFAEAIERGDHRRK